MLDFSFLLALCTFYFVMYATPGPNNAMILSSGIQFGFLRTLPHMAGITIGHVIQLILVCLGFGSIFTIIPELQTVLKIFCALYLCFLSYKLLGSLNIAQKETSRPLKFYEGAIFQLANPKAWTISTMAAAGFLDRSIDVYFSILVISSVALIVCPISMAPWPAFGAAIKIYIKNGSLKKIIEYFLAILLLMTAILILTG